MSRDKVYGYFRVEVPSDDPIFKYDLGYICIRLDRPPIEAKGIGLYKASFSFCSPLDNNQFSRKKARLIADGRMEFKGTEKRLKGFIELEIKEFTSLNDVYNLALKQLIDEDKVPRWVIPGSIRPGITPIQRKTNTLSTVA